MVTEGIQHIGQALSALVVVSTAIVVTGIDAGRQQVALGVRHVVCIVGGIAWWLLVRRGRWWWHVLPMVLVLNIALSRMTLNVSLLLSLEVVLVRRMMLGVLPRVWVRVRLVLHVRVMPLVVG